MVPVLRIRTEAGEQTLDLDAFEASVARGELADDSLVCFEPLTGDGFVRADALELYRRLRERPQLRGRGAARMRFPKITAGLMLVQLALFGAMTLSGPIDQNALVAWGAKVGPLMIDAGQLWRLLTANLLHENALHVGFNLLVLFNVGAALEQVYRRLDYGLVLLASALGTTLASLWALPQAVTAGSSGIVYGAMGAAVVFGLKHREHLPVRYRRVLGEATLPAVLVFLYVGFTSTGVDNWAHLGGLGAGVLSALWLVPRSLAKPRGTSARLLVASPFALVAVVVAAGGALLFRAPPRTRAARDDVFGIEARVPGLWRRGAERYGQIAFSNGLTGLGKASFTAQAQLAGPAGLEGAAAAFIARELAPEAKAGTIHRLSLEGPLDGLLDGRPAKRLEGRFEEEGTATRMRAYFVARGEVIYELVFRWSERYSAYERRVEEMGASLRFIEPRAVVEARGRALNDPSAANFTALGATLHRLGETRGAQDALEEAERRGPQGAEGLAQLAQACLTQGLAEEGCRLAQRAEAAQPESAPALEAQADCAAARQDRLAMRRYLERAAAAAPSDERLQERAREEAGRAP